MEQISDPKTGMRVRFVQQFEIVKDVKPSKITWGLGWSDSMQSIVVWLRSENQHNNSFRQSMYFPEGAEAGVKRDLGSLLNRRQLGRAIRKCRRIIGMLRPVTISG